MTDNSILDRFGVVLLDMNGTFMFNEDRFGTEHDYAATYRSIGGKLPAERVRRLIHTCYGQLAELYSNPTYYECFPTVTKILYDLPETDGLSKIELIRLEQTFAAHELGHIPTKYAGALHQLAATHRLGLVADIWAEKSLWLNELRRAGVFHLFDVMVFSSDTGSVKPSPRPFLTAVEKLNAKPGDCIVVGDSARRDIGGAKAAGLSSIWIGLDKPPKHARWIVSDLLRLVQ